MLVAMEVLFKRLPKLKLAGMPHYKDVYHFHGLEELRVTF
jgi:unspecific monooxygenase